MDSIPAIHGIGDSDRLGHAVRAHAVHASGSTWVKRASIPV
jgi:hypothetical protein